MSFVCIPEVHGGVTRIWFIVWGDLEQVLSHGSETEWQSSYLSFSFAFFHFTQSVESLIVVMAVMDMCPHIIKRVGPVSSVHSSSTGPVGQNPPRSCQKLGQTLLGIGDAGRRTGTVRRHTMIILVNSTMPYSQLAVMKFVTKLFLTESQTIFCHYSLT